MVNDVVQTHDEIMNELDAIVMCKAGYLRRPNMKITEIDNLEVLNVVKLSDDVVWETAMLNEWCIARPLSDVDFTMVLISNEDIRTNRKPMVIDGHLCAHYEAYGLDDVLTMIINRYYLGNIIIVTDDSVDALLTSHRLLVQYTTTDGVVTLPIFKNDLDSIDVSDKIIIEIARDDLRLDYSKSLKHYKLPITAGLLYATLFMPEVHKEVLATTELSVSDIASITALDMRIIKLIEAHHGLHGIDNLDIAKRVIDTIPITTIFQNAITEDIIPK